VNPPSALVAVMVAVPFATGETSPPIAVTVAIAGLLDVQLILWLEAAAGITAAVSKFEVPMITVALEALMVMPVTEFPDGVVEAAGPVVIAV